MEPFVLKEEQGHPALFMLEPWMSRYDGISAGFTGRNGGVGQAPYDSLNCAFHVGDRPEDVISNRKLIAGLARIHARCMDMRGTGPPRRYRDH